MARFYPSGGTGGADVSVVTAMKENVEKGKVIVGPDGEPITGELELTGTAADSQVLAGQTYYNTDLHQKRTGTMANQGAWKSEGLAAGAEVAIPPGYHNGGGKVTAKDLASQTPGDATAAQIWTGRKAWVNGQQVMGTLATQGGSTTIPGTAAKTIVTPNKIVTGNIVVAGDPNLIPANIKKGVPIFGVMGIAEGYFPTATDLYLRGNNIKSFRRLSGTESSASFDTGQITISSFVQIGTDVTVNFTGYSRINIQGKVDITSGSQSSSIRLIDYDSLGLLATVVWDSSPSAADYSKSIDITAFQYDRKVRLEFSEAKGAIYRIWLS